MNVLFAHREVDAGYSKHDDEENDSRRRCVRGIATALAVKHIVYVSNYGVHLRYVEVASEKGNRIAIRLKCSDKACYDEVEEHGGDERYCDPCEHSEAACSVHFCCIIIIRINGSDRAGENEYLEGKNDPYRVEAKNEHLCPVRTCYKVNSFHAEEAEDNVDYTRGMVCLLEEKHKYKSNRQGIGNVGKEEYSLEKIAKLLYRGKSERYKQGEKCRHRNGYNNQNKCVLHRLNKEGIVQNVKVIVKTDSEECT